MLSQWRAYAENGAGFAIGLDPFVLQAMPVTLLEVCYDRQLQAERIADGVDYLRELHQLIGQPEPALAASLTEEQLQDDETGLPALLRAQIDRFALAVRFLTLDLVAFKNPAFSEESEVRLVHYVVVRGIGALSLFRSRTQASGRMGVNPGWISQCVGLSRSATRTFLFPERRSRRLS